MEFYQAITADLLELRSGRTRMKVNQTLTSLDIGPGTQLDPEANTITVTGTLSGSGDIDNGGGTVTVTGDGWSTGDATLTRNGNALELSGVALSGVQGTVLMVRQSKALPWGHTAP